MARSSIIQAILCATAGFSVCIDNQRRADSEALRPLAAMVGPWRGAGQPVRGSARGAWSESGKWTWSIEKNSAALVFTIEKGKHLNSLTIRRGGVAGQLSMLAVLPDGASTRLAGSLAQDGKRWIFVSESRDAPDDRPARITLTPLHDTRFLVLLEKATESPTRFDRLAEIGYTRQGVRFAAGDSFPECIVTGGRGTIAVSHAGKTYHVCCSGCKDAFDDDPAGILAEYRERKAAGKP
jgi:YHS domain-containing protein